MTLPSSAVPQIRIPFNRASLTGRELDYVQQAVEQGHISGDGPFTRQCHEMLEKLTGSKKALLTTSCTHALEMAALLLDLQPGDEVIVPSFTFVSTANAFALRGARIVFADIRPDTLNLDEQLLPGLITQRTRAVVVVHYAGVACEMKSILATCDKHGIPVIEDNAHGFLGQYHGKPLGSFGAMATLSFHETKNITCGEGGALMLNEDRWIDRAEIIREKGTNRSRFFRGQVDKYTWVDIGSSYLPSDMLAAILCAQLESKAKIQSERMRIWNTYHRELTDWARTNNITLPTVPAGCEQPAHLYYLLMPDINARQAIIQHLRDHGIMVVFHYVPLHSSPMGRQVAARNTSCPVTEDASDRLVRLPIYSSLTSIDQRKIVDTVRQFE